MVIDKMKIILISLLFIFTANAQSIYYVDRYASGSGNGTSWTNAWNSLDQITWGSLSAGDSVYVSGGTDSTVYLTQYPSTNCIITSGVTYASGNPVVVARGWQAGHNGRVIFRRYNKDYQWLFHIRGVSNIKLYGFEFLNTALDTSQYYTGVAYLGGGDQGDYFDSLQTFEQCTFTDNGWGGNVTLVGCKITLKDCVIDQPYNANCIDNDILTGSGGRGGHTIDGCKVIQRNVCMSTTAHRDLLQFSDMGVSGENLLFTVKNCLLLKEGNGDSWNGMIYSPNRRADNQWLIYNNIIAFEGANTNTSSVGGLFIYGAGAQGLSAKIFHNTMILKGSSNVLLTVDSGFDSLMIRNNLFLCDASTSHLIDVTDAVANQNMVIDYNVWGMNGGVTGGMFYSLNGIEDFSTWQSTSGFDVHGFTVDTDTVNFVNKYGDQITDYYTNTGVGLAENLGSQFPYLQYDILGNPRGSTWDIGALQFSFDSLAVDSLPDAFTFTDVTNATRSTLYTSNGVTLAGFDSAYAYASGNIYTINAGSDLTGYTMVYPNDVLRLKLTSSGSYSTGVSSTLNVGGRTDTYTVTTESAPIVPSGNGGVAKGSNGLIWRDSTGKIIKVAE